MTSPSKSSRRERALAWAKQIGAPPTSLLAATGLGDQADVQTPPGIATFVKLYTLHATSLRGVERYARAVDGETVELVATTNVTVNPGK